jgi:hypothetical protein
MLAELEELAELGRPTPAPERGRMMSYWVWEHDDDEGFDGHDDDEDCA